MFRAMMQTFHNRMLIFLGALAAAAAIGLGPIAAHATSRDTELPNDRQIEHEVADRLLLDHGVQGHDIDVEVLSGVVTLTGTTRNILARKRAARIAGTMKGVRAVINHIEVKTVNRLDRHIHADVRLALFESLRTEGFEVDIDVTGGILTLAGTVDSFRERDLVERVASQVPGIVKVDNRIGVRIGSRSDKEIAEDVRGALVWDRYINADPISVDVQDGRVTLSGEIGSVAEHGRAVTDASVIGVTDIDAAQLEVNPSLDDAGQRAPGGSPPSDAEIASAVKDALLFDPHVFSEKILVEVEDGVVTLRGETHVLASKQAAARVARDTVGVERVRNRLRVRPQVRSEDAESAHRIVRMWERNPYLNHYNLDARVVDGKATLEGTVDSYFDKANAEMLAYAIQGVVHVSNDISVIRTAEPLTYNPYVDDWYPYDYDWHRLRAETKKSDLAIRQDIERELWWSPFVDANQVVVEVDGGVATLTGAVDSPAERRTATENALEGGALKVVNELALSSRQSD